MEQPRSYSVAVMIAGTPEIHEKTAFEYEGKLVLVASWLQTSDGTQKWPEQVIPLHSLRHEFAETPEAPFQIAILDPLPAELFDRPVSASLRRAFGVFAVPAPDLEPGGTA